VGGDIRPDLIVVHDDLPDMSAMDACELLRRDLRIGHNVPILILAGDRPTPGQRVAAVSAGAWDFLRYPGEPRDLAIKLQSYLQAKRNPLSRHLGEADDMSAGLPHEDLGGAVERLTARVH